MDYLYVVKSDNTLHWSTDEIQLRPSIVTSSYIQLARTFYKKDRVEFTFTA